MNYYNENDRRAAAWLRELIRENLIAKGDVDERSISDVRADELMGYTQCHFFAGIGGWSYALRLAGWPDDEPVWTGSCPCQPFADCGEGKGFDDDRHLWPDFFKLIDKRRPPIILGEQVASEAALGWLDCVFSDLERASYSCAAADLCAASVLSTQRRARLFWMANSNDAGWKRGEREGKPHQAREERAAACRESLRSNCGPWPPGPREVGRIPVLAHGLPGTVGRCRGYGNAIVPQVAAEFIQAAREAIHLTK